MSGAANRTRGANAERAVVRYLWRNGFPGARRYMSGDGRQPGDIDFHPDVCLEVKDVESSRWPTWRAQAIAEARPGQLVVVVRRVRGVTDVGRWEAQCPTHHCARICNTPLDHNSTWCDRTETRWWVTHLGLIVHHLQPRIPGLETT